MAKRHKPKKSLEAAASIRVDAGVAAYQAFYGRTGEPCPTPFRTDEQLADNRAAVERIIADERAAYAGPLKGRQVELIAKRDVTRLPYRLIATFEKLDLEEVRACLGVAGAWYDEHDVKLVGGELKDRDPEAWHWSKTARFWEPDPSAALMRIAEEVCPEAVARVRCRVALGTLWQAEQENAEMARRFPRP